MTMVTQFEDMAMKLSDDARNASRQVWLAGLGATAVVGDTSKALFGMLVEEGKKYQKHELKLVDELVRKTTDKMRATGETVENRVQATTKVALNRLGMPSRKDVADLTKRLEQLTVKVNAIRDDGARRQHVVGRHQDHRSKRERAHGK